MRWKALRGPAGLALSSSGVVAVLLFASGCGGGALVTTDALPVSRVVVYRNGVAYFERSGRVEGDEVRFRMKPTEVGDFLATLAVMEKGGSSVRAAAFPIDTGEAPADAPEGDDGKPSDGKVVDAGGPKKAPGLATVRLSLDGRTHDLNVGYVAESPVWRPSYRLVVQPDGKADLQVWGIVQNLSGEDWTHVKLSLIAGAPLAFQAELGTPVIPTRPTITDEGEVIAAVPRSVTSLRQEAEAPPPPPAPAPAMEAAPASVDGRGAVDDEEDKSEMPMGGAAPKAPRAMRKMAPAASAPAPEPYNGQAISAPRSLRSLAAIAVEGSTTRYDLPVPVTIPDKSATMVMLLSRSVSGEAVFLYAPDPGVSDSASHPFRVARFTNGSAGVLEKGPIAVFEGGAFLGQGMVDPLPAGATATVPFALERGIAVDEDHDTDEIGARLAKIENGVLTIERDRSMKTTYRIRNGGDEAATILVRHPRSGGSQLFEPPRGTEDNVGTGSALVPTSVPPHATAKLVVDERATERFDTDWLSVAADTAVKTYLAGPKHDADFARRLSALWQTRGELADRRTERDALQRQTLTLSEATDETRRDLHAIEKNKSAEALRQKLTARLTEASGKLDDLNRKIVELNARISELEIAFKEGVRDIKFLAPPT